jgi:hypothetical protein
MNSGPEPLVQIGVNYNANSKPDAGTTSRAASVGAKTRSFWFGSKRSAVDHPKRLFQPQKSLISPAWDPDDRATKILRTVCSLG